MANRLRLELLVAGLVLIAASIHLRPSVADDPFDTFAPLLRRVTPAVVNVAANVPGSGGEQGAPRAPSAGGSSFDHSAEQSGAQSIGSGVVVDGAQGLILTNYHVVHGASSIVVTLADRRQFDATLVASDPATDIALLEIRATDLVALPFGDSDELEVGDFVLAIGNPFGLGQTATSGIVSALGRGSFTGAGYEDFIQTDASINPGSSGGPLIDVHGRLMGINTAILSPAGGNVGIGFAIPSNMARQIAAQLLEHGGVRQRGIALQDAHGGVPRIVRARSVATRLRALR